ncbi:MAG: aminotransferase class III-fold pyridoxal phosphate-dependent enzyme, partial [Ornithinimicrobium sp.]
MTDTLTAPTANDAIEPSNSAYIELEGRVAANNYSPLPVVVDVAEGIWVHDVEGNKYLDALSGYSALNFGHRHPDLIAAAKDQLDRLTLTSRAFHNDALGPFCR